MLTLVQTRIKYAQKHKRVNNRLSLTLPSLNGTQALSRGVMNTALAEIRTETEILHYQQNLNKELNSCDGAY
jgi:hypothetical protein